MLDVLGIQETLIMSFLVSLIFIEDCLLSKLEENRLTKLNKYGGIFNSTEDNSGRKDNSSCVPRAAAF